MMPRNPWYGPAEIVLPAAFSGAGLPFTSGVKLMRYPDAPPGSVNVNPVSVGGVAVSVAIRAASGEKSCVKTPDRSDVSCSSPACAAAYACV